MNKVFFSIIFITIEVVAPKSNFCTFTEYGYVYVPKNKTILEKVEKHGKWKILKIVNPLNLFKKATYRNVTSMEYVLEKKVREYVACCHGYIKSNDDCVPDNSSKPTRIKYGESFSKERANELPSHVTASVANVITTSMAENEDEITSSRSRSSATFNEITRTAAEVTTTSPISDTSAAASEVADTRRRTTISDANSLVESTDTIDATTAEAVADESTSETNNSDGNSVSTNNENVTDRRIIERTTVSFASTHPDDDETTAAKAIAISPSVSSVTEVASVAHESTGTPVSEVAEGGSRSVDNLADEPTVQRTTVATVSDATDSSTTVTIAEYIMPVIASSSLPNTTVAVEEMSGTYTRSPNPVTFTKAIDSTLKTTIDPFEIAESTSTVVGNDLSNIADLAEAKTTELTTDSYFNSAGSARPNTDDVAAERTTSARTDATSVSAIADETTSESIAQLTVASTWPVTTAERRSATLADNVTTNSASRKEVQRLIVSPTNLSVLATTDVTIDTTADDLLTASSISTAITDEYTVAFHSSGDEKLTDRTTTIDGAEIKENINIVSNTKSDAESKTKFRKTILGDERVNENIVETYDVVTDNNAVDVSSTLPGTDADANASTMDYFATDNNTNLNVKMNGTIKSQKYKNNLLIFIEHVVNKMQRFFTSLKSYS